MTIMGNGSNDLSYQTSMVSTLTTNKTFTAQALTYDDIAVHFLFKGHLDRGVACNSTCDVLGKNVAEHLRAKHVHIPKIFLDKGKI